MIDLAKRKAVEHEIENIEFEHTSIFDEKYKTESFDVILAFNILVLIKMNLVPNILTRFKISELKDLIKNGSFEAIETENIYYKMYSYFVVAKKNIKHNI